MALIKIENESAWHKMRAQNIGASEVAALFGLSPWTTKWKLYMQKSGQLPPVNEKAWMSRGRHFEPAIASYAREEFDLPITKVEHYMTDDACPGLAASFDYAIVASLPLEPVEIKWAERYDGWEWTADELTLIPDYYMLQVQHQMACSGAEKGMLIAFVGGAVRYMTIPRSGPIIAAIREAVTTFWSNIQHKVEPPVDFLEDSETIMLLAKSRPLRTMDLPPHALGLFEIYLENQARAKEAEQLVDRSKAELVKMVLDNSGMGNDGQAVASCGFYTMKLSKVADSPGKLVTNDMVGQFVGARKGYLRVTVGDKKNAS